MAFDYAASAATALKLITKFGREVKISRASGLTKNRVTGAATGGADLTGTMKVVILPATAGKIQSFGDNYAEDLIRGSIRFVIGEAVNTPFDPISGDRLKFDNEEWEIIGNTALKPAGTRVINKMGIRKR